jgi:ribosomal protein S18 acetylase RimI-like enzyme
MIIEGDRIRIQNVGESELDEILGVYQHCEDFLSLGPVPIASKQMVLDDLRLSDVVGGIFCGIFQYGKMIGVVDFVPKDYDGDPESAYLSLLMIADRYRSKGIGSEAVKLIETEILKNHSITTIYAGVQTNNTRAIRFWKGMGYNIIGGPTDMPDKTTVYEPRKDINGR